MNDYYLNTTTEAAMKLALVEASAATVDDGKLQMREGVSMDVIGTWAERTGGTDEEPVYTTAPGWHFNVRSVDPIVWPESVNHTTPVTPWRVWG